MVRNAQANWSGNKRRNYDLWKQAVRILQAGEHLSGDGLDRILAIKADLNRYVGTDETAETDSPETTGPA